MDDTGVGSLRRGNNPKVWALNPGVSKYIRYKVKGEADKSCITLEERSIPVSGGRVEEAENR